MKAYTDIEQSKKLAEILPIESADMRYSPLGDNLHPWIWTDTFLEKDAVPCWSLAALLDVIPAGTVLLHDINGLGYKCIKAVDTNWHNNPVDACVEMIFRLHKHKML